MSAPYVPGRGGRTPVPVDLRFWYYVDKDGPDGCWVWTGGTNQDGYGIISLGRTPTRAHRLVFKMLGLVEPRSDQLVCHHCDNPPCVNPDHLFFGTYLDNILDSIAKGRRRQGWRVTHCPKGHPFDDANSYITKRGPRACRACNRIAMQRRRDAAKANRAAS